MGGLRRASAMGGNPAGEGGEGGEGGTNLQA